MDKISFKLLICVIILFRLCTGYSGLNGQEVSDGIPAEKEYALKSAYIYKICKFSIWPRMSETDSSFVISILGDMSSDKEIKIPEDKEIGNRKIVIKKIDDIDEIDDSEAVFICSSEADRLDLIIEYVQNKAILTFGDTEGFGERGVMFNFYLEDEYVKMEINRKFALESLVKPHSRLFTIGRIIN